MTFDLFGNLHQFNNLLVEETGDTLLFGRDFLFDGPAFRGRRVLDGLGGDSAILDFARYFVNYIPVRCHLAADDTGAEPPATFQGDYGFVTGGGAAGEHHAGTE